MILKCMRTLFAAEQTTPPASPKEGSRPFKEEVMSTLSLCWWCK